MYDEMTTQGRITVAVLILFVLTILVLYITAEKKVTQYELSGFSGPITIRANTSWSEDSFIPLVNVTYWEAIAMVDSLNKTLK